MGDVTSLLGRARGGDADALGSLFELLYPDLKRIAHARLRAGPRDALVDTTMLVHECYLKLLRAEQLAPASRAHFLAYVAHAMRSIIVDLARAQRAQRRGGGVAHVTLDTAAADRLAAPEDEILDVHGALQELEQVEPRLAQVVELRYFAGLGDADIAQALGVTDRTVRRDWNKARLLLAERLRL